MVNTKEIKTTIFNASEILEGIENIIEIKETFKICNGSGNFRKGMKLPGPTYIIINNDKINEIVSDIESKRDLIPKTLNDNWKNVTGNYSKLIKTILK